MGTLSNRCRVTDKAPLMQYFPFSYIRGLAFYWICSIYDLGGCHSADQRETEAEESTFVFRSQFFTSIRTTILYAFQLHENEAEDCRHRKGDQVQKHTDPKSVWDQD